MIGRMSKGVLGRAAGLAAGVMLALAAVAAVPAVRAQAASSPVAWVGTSSSHSENPDWGVIGGGPTPWTCSYSWQTEKVAEPILEIYNPCSTRMWVHYYNYDSASYSSYCVNPGGGLAYNEPFFSSWSSGDSADIQLTSNSDPCLWPAKGLSVSWSDGTRDQDYCGLAETTSSSVNWIEAATNGCDTRVWLHVTSSGSTGATLCLDNYNGGAENTYTLNPASSTTFFQYQVTLNQAPCSAGGAPYSY
jgi:hypothetical protein